MSLSLRPLLLLVAVVLGVAVVGQVIRLDTGWQAPAPIEPASVEIVPLPAALTDDERLGSLATLNALEEAPLFWPSRRPPPEKPAEPVESPPKEDPLEDVRLLGTFTSSGQGGVVLSIKSGKDEPRVERLTVGEELDGLTLKNVSPVAVLFEDRQGGQHTLPLEIERPQINAMPAD